MTHTNQFIFREEKPNYRELAIIKEAEKRLIANRGKYRQQKSHIFESDFWEIRADLVVRSKV